MLFKSTGKNGILSTLKEAILHPLPEDGGLYLPQYIPKNFLPAKWRELPFKDLCIEIARPFLIQDFLESKIEEIVSLSITFDAPIYKLNEKISFLELWHGPTLAFKDFGARFLARLLENFREKQTHILVATSGDTGAAVAAGFLNIQGITVHVLYPKGKITAFQEAQIRTLGNNIKTYAIEGDFDDCQRIVKKAFLDKEINEKIVLSSANSINIGRLIPQIFYYFRGTAQLSSSSIDVIVPSGNFGNFTAAIMAKMMGAPIGNLTAATNSNDTILRYFQTGVYEPKDTKVTLSNAMDVSAPSNFERIWGLLGRNVHDLTNYFTCKSVPDDHCKMGIMELYDQYNYLIDPHTATGYLAANFLSGNPQLILSTAHPCKFLDCMQKIWVGKKLPKDLDISLEGITLNKSHENLSKHFVDFKSCLMDF